MKKIKIYVMFFLVTAMLAAMLLPASAEDQIHEEKQALAGFEDLSGEQFEALWDADSESLFMLLTNVRSLAVVTDAEHVPQKGKSLRITAWSGSYFTLSSAGEVTGLPDMNNFYGFDGLAFWLDTTDSINARGKLDVTLGSGSGDSQYEVVARDIEFHGGTQAVLEVPFSAFMSDGEEDGFTFEQINSLALHFHSLGNLGGTYYLSSFSLYRDGAIRMDKLEVAREEAEEYLSSLTSEDYSRESLEEATGRFLALCEECDNPLLTGTQLRVNQLTAEFLNIPSLLRPADWRQTLAELVSLCGQADISVYTEQSLEQFFQALTEAEQALESGETDPDILRALYNALEEAWQGLEAEALYTAGLELLISNCEEYEGENYSRESWNALIECLDQAKELLRGNPTQEQINQAELALLDAMERLVPVAALDYTAIEAAIAHASALQAEDYTADSFSFMQSMKRAAEAELASPERTQAGLTLCADNLNAAIDALIQVYINKESLSAAIARVRNLAAGDYTAASYNALIDRVNEAAAALYDPEVKQAEINSWADEIGGLIRRLVRRGIMEKAELTGLIQSAEKLDGGAYESTGFKAFERALAEVKAVAANEEATATQINAAGVKLLSAWGKLQGYAYSPYITDFDYKSMQDFEGVNLDKSVLKVITQVPFDGTRGLGILFDVGEEDILTVSPSGANLREYPDIRGYEGVEYYANTAAAEGLYALTMQLSVEDETGESIYTIESETESGEGYTRVNFPFSKAEISGSNAHDLYDYNRIGMGVIASCGELEVTALRAYRMSMAKLPEETQGQQTTGSSVVKAIAEIIKNPKTGDIGLGASLLLLIISVAVILRRAKRMKFRHAK